MRGFVIHAEERSGGAVMAERSGRSRRREPSFERTPRDILIGAALVLAGGVMWGTNATVSKLLMGTYHADPLWIACVRELFAGITFLAVAAVRQRRLLIGALADRKGYPSLIGSALVCVLLVQVAYLCSINATNAGTATVLQSLNLLFVLAYVCIRRRRWPNLRESVGVALAFAGVVLLATGGDLTTIMLPAIGLMWGLINAAATAAMSVLPIRLIARWGNMTVNGIMFVISGLVLLPVVRPWASAPALDWFGALLMVYTVVFGTFGAFGLFLAGMMRVGSMRATMLGTSEPVAATITSVAWAGAVFSPADFAGFAMILAMVFLVR
ncbi:EamA family transporter [Bifidobacterium sp. SO1]|nr:EamA family transporter [Bifidobacterium sp. SO1]